MLIVNKTLGFVVNHVLAAVTAAYRLVLAWALGTGRVLIWLMIYPMMIQVDFSAVRDVGKKPRGLALTLVVNWLIKPFTMAAIGWLFFRVFFADWVDPQTASEYIAGI